MSIQAVRDCKILSNLQQYPELQYSNKKCTKNKALLILENPQIGNSIKFGLVHTKCADRENGVGATIERQKDTES